jgi:hypothetical protein
MSGAAPALADPHALRPAQERPTLVDQADRQPALPVQLDVARHVPDRHAAADVAAPDRALLADQSDLGQREAVIGVRQAGGDRGAAAPGDLPGELHCRPSRRATSTPPGGRGAHRLRAVGITGIEGIGGAELAGERQLILDEVERADPPGAGEPRAERLVPQRHRRRPRPIAVDHREIRVAQPGGLDLDQDLAALSRT